MATYSTGSAIRVDFENTYEYKGKIYNSMDAMAQTLNYDLNTVKDLRQYDKDVEKTLKYAVELAKEFIDSVHPVNPYNRYQTTNRLRENVKYDTQTSSGGTGGRLYDDAKDNRGRKYAGHIEYGFTDKAGVPRGPWPFLRPAMRLALSATRYDFAETMQNLITGDFSKGYMTIGSKDSKQNVLNLYGSNREAVSHVKHQFGSFGQSRWSVAENGIGFKSHVEYGFRASPESWAEGRV